MPAVALADHLAVVSYVVFGADGHAVGLCSHVENYLTVACVVEVRASSCVSRGRGHPVGSFVVKKGPQTVDTSTAEHAEYVSLLIVKF